MNATPPSREKAVNVADLMLERARWVQDELDRMLPDIRPLKFYESLKEYLELSRNRVRPSMAVYEPMRHVIEAGGKRIRPALCLLACEAVGGDPKRAITTAAAIELIHTFTLIHDDIMDEDMVRRGRPTIAAIWGNPIAITAGDGLFALAFRTIARNAQNPGLEPELVLHLLDRASETCLALCQGQTMDLLLEEDDAPTEEGYLEMIRLKTGVLLEYALEAGAIIGGAKPAIIAQVRRYGAPVGMAFQIKDDLLNLTASTEVLGKPHGSDIVRGKRTLMVAHALANLPRQEGRRLRTLLDQAEHKTTPADIEEAIALMRKSGSLQYAEQFANDLIRDAKAALKAFPKGAASDALKVLHQMADFAIQREA